MFLECSEVSYFYPASLPDSPYVLKDINLLVPPADLLGLVGPTGAGKSTLLQLLKGFQKPSKGEIFWDGLSSRQRKEQLAAIQKKIGFVSQFPEQQLFAETVAADVAFGPRHLGLGKREIAARVEEAMALVGLDIGSYGERSPFSLSDGEMRRVALAGILALQPEVLLLDEPTVGLDPEGAKSFWELLALLHQQKGLTLIVISHDLEALATFAKRLVVLYEGRIVFEGSPQDFFSLPPEVLKSFRLRSLLLTTLLQALRAQGFSIRTDLLTVEEAAEEISRAFKCFS